MKKITVLIQMSLLLWLCPPAGAGETGNATLTRVGDEAPAFTCRTIDGTRFALAELKGKVVLVNFFAAWCDPCNVEMPRLEQEIWTKYKDRKFVMVAIGREHSAAELAEFREKHKLTFTLAPDPKREIYGRFATESVPRTYVIAADGRIAYQSEGYSASEFARLPWVIQAELDKIE
ncbi:MAG: peroxiredoxin family protein [Gammaproteobacteria bacterium]